MLSTWPQLGRLSGNSRFYNVLHRAVLESHGKLRVSVGG